MHPPTCWQASARDQVLLLYLQAVEPFFGLGERSDELTRLRAKVCFQLCVCVFFMQGKYLSSRFTKHLDKKQNILIILGAFSEPNSKCNFN